MIISYQLFKMKNNEMQEHLIRIFNRFSLRGDLINRLVIDTETYIYRDDVSEDDRWGYYIWVCKELKIKNRIMRSKGINSEGGRKMKIEGHLNEELITSEIINTIDDSIVKNLLKHDENVVDIICDGINTKKVDSIFNNKKTTSKCDIKVITNQKIIKLSIKKSNSGQVHLNKVKSFIDGYELTYNPIPNIVKDALLFLFSGHENTLSILNDKKYYNELTNSMELHHRTLTVETMNKYHPSLSVELLSWVKNNIKNITEIVFKRGWAINQDDWVEYILYSNKINENSHIDDLINIDTLIQNSNEDHVKFGVENGGTTIQLPFGHLQYHLGGLQFHHNRKKILNIIG
jgi:hypothetical protein